MTIPNHYQHAAGYADRIEVELRRIGAWQNQPPPPEAFESTVAFFGDTMSFHQWIQFVLLERIRSVVAEQGNFPRRSQVGVYATRELDCDPDGGPLTSLLNEFDDFIESMAR
jgi:uncharacterized protein YqcC (DUF446 family)